MLLACGLPLQEGTSTRYSQTELGIEPRRTAKWKVHCLFRRTPDWKLCCEECNKLKSPFRSGSERMVGIDMLRGACLVEMMANHLPPGLVTSSARETLGFISAAEGFVFLSGFIAGWTSCVLIQRKPAASVQQRFLARAGQLYATYCVLLSAVLACVALGGTRFSEWGQLCYVNGGSVGRVWLYGIPFLHQPQYLDIFPIYCVFLVLTPLIIAQLRAGRRWLVLAISGAVWAVSQFWSGTNVPGMIWFGYFNLFSWQLLFTVGLTFGFHHEAQQEEPTQSSWVFVLCAGLCAMLFALRHLPRFGVEIPALTTSILVEKSTLGVIRLVNFAAMAYILRAILAWLPPGARGNWAFRQLAFLGQHSLQVFSWSVAMTFIAFLSGDTWRNLPLTLQISVPCAAILSLWVPARLHVLWGDWDLRKARCLTDARRTPSLVSGAAIIPVTTRQP